jgi:putative restriction endonuclease
MPDWHIRRAAFDWLTEQVAIHGPALPRQLLAAGFQLDGDRVPLLGPQGIFKPQVMTLPLSITTVANGPYEDAFGTTFLRYKYRGTDPTHRDNAGLRQLIHDREPLVYFHALVPGKYLAVWPVFIVGDDPASLTFSVAVDDASAIQQAEEAGLVASDVVADIRRGYVTAVVRRRIHQEAFRERVIDAYRQQCALCKLRHEELLDAAHIVADSEPDGEPVIPNGLALCKLHHAAFDRFFLSVRPDYAIEIRRDLLQETDGPMLRHGLQGMHGQKIVLPSRMSLRPSQELLARRHALFLERTM